MTDDIEDCIATKLALTIRQKHKEILDEWFKACVASRYQETGEVRPYEFVLNQCLDGDQWKFWFTLKD